MASSIGVICESTAIPPIATMTDVSPRNSGTSAATSGPEREEEDEQRDRERDQLRRAQLARDDLADRLVRRARPAASTVTLRVLGFDPVDGGR